MHMTTFGNSSVLYLRRLATCPLFFPFIIPKVFVSLSFFLAGRKQVETKALHGLGWLSTGPNLFTNKKVLIGWLGRVLKTGFDSPTHVSCLSVLACVPPTTQYLSITQ